MLRNFFSIAEEFIYTSTLCWFFGGKGGRVCVGVGGGQGECVGVGVRVEGGCRRGGGGTCQIGVGVGVNPTHPFGISFFHSHHRCPQCRLHKISIISLLCFPSPPFFSPPFVPATHTSTQPPATAPAPSLLTPNTKDNESPPSRPHGGGGIKGGEEKHAYPPPPTPGRARRSIFTRSIFKDGCVVENLENGSDSDELRQDQRRSDRRDICQVSGAVRRLYTDTLESSSPESRSPGPARGGRENKCFPRFGPFFWRRAVSGPGGSISRARFTPSALVRRSGDPNRTILVPFLGFASPP